MVTEIEFKESGSPKGHLNLDEGHWQLLFERMESETGMALGVERRTSFRTAAGPLLLKHGVETNVDLARILESGREARLLESLTSTLTVGETFFFRNQDHFSALRDNVLPAILEANAALHEIRIWSAGCATGEEPYSLAILCDQVLQTSGGWQISVLATDLSTEFLKKARDASFRPWSFRGTDIHLNRAYFTAEGESFRLARRIADRVRFSYLNLVKDVYPSPLTGTAGLDLILFRNVAIYLKRPVVMTILERLHRALKPGGWLLLSETEVFPDPPAGFEVVRFGQATFLRKAGGPELTRDLIVPTELPVLQEALFSTTYRLADPPALPEWVPLPAFPSPAAEEPPTWERIEQRLLRRKFDEANEILGKVEPRKDRALLRVRYAKALLSVGDHGRARRMIDLCIEEESLQLEAHLLRASMSEDQGDLAGAEASYRRALYLDRTCPMAHFRLALVQHQRGNSVGASRSLETLLRLTEAKDPHARLDFGEGLCYGRLRELVSVLREGVV